MSRDIKSLVESFLNESGERVKASKELVAHRNLNSTPGSVSEFKIPSGAEMIVLEQPSSTRKETKVLYNNTIIFVDLDQ